MGILSDVKHYLGIAPDDNYFDPSLLMCINSVFSNLTQVGVGLEEGFSVSDDTSDWTDFVSDYAVSWIKMNVCTNVKKMFDPPSNGTLMQALDDISAETQWRAYIDADNKL